MISRRAFLAVAAGTAASASGRRPLADGARPRREPTSRRDPASGWPVCGAHVGGDRHGDCRFTHARWRSSTDVSGSSWSPSICSASPPPCASASARRCRESTGSVPSRGCWPPATRTAAPSSTTSCRWPTTSTPRARSRIARYTAELEATLARIAGEALGHLRPVTLRFGRRPGGFGANRRAQFLPPGPVDPDGAGRYVSPARTAARWPSCSAMRVTTRRSRRR